MGIYDYHNSEIRAERLLKGRDHCDSDGAVHALPDLVVAERVIDPERGGNLTTTPARRLIYAIDAALRIHVGFDGERGTGAAVKHETLFHNEPVDAAGELHVADGVVDEINDQSGSYGTTGLMEVDRRFARAVLKAFERAQIPMSDAMLDSLKASAGL